MNDLTLGLDFLVAQSGQSLVAMFWYTIVFEIPRYGLAFVAIGIAPLAAKLLRRRAAGHPRASDAPGTISVVIVGHNEADSLELCVRSLREQSLKGFEIVIVSDGSSDRMAAVASRLVKEGLADRALATDLRSGKASGVNLAIRASTGKIIINVDCDCSYDRFAIENIVKPFSDPTVGAVCGDIVPRNGNGSLVARFQEIEYAYTLSVGKRIAASVEQVNCVSGAFGAFRREALDSVGGFDVGGGEDLDTTLRFRQKHWRVAFAENAICYTDVPSSLWALFRQRLRWERDVIWIRYRKHWRLMDPSSERFKLSEAFHQWDFLAFNILGAVVFPLYIVWLYVTYGAFATPILVAMQAGLCAIEIPMLAIAAFVTGRPVFWRNLPYVLGYSAFSSYGMRLIRLCAYVEEWFLSASHWDNYTPLKVRAARKW
jgi:cellulose synthase/poly-beta-1,6-N-acetylglucosamine synthase-like glycosyltransferase